jgi:hypothetical protein
MQGKSYLSVKVENTAGSALIFAGLRLGNGPEVKII